MAAWVDCLLAGLLVAGPAPASQAADRPWQAWAAEVVQYEGWRAVSRFWHIMLLTDPVLEARVPDLRARVLADLARQQIAQAQADLPPHLLNAYDWLVMRRVLEAAGRYADRPRKPREPALGYLQTPVERHFPGVALTVEALLQMRGQPLEEAVLRQCEDRLLAGLEACQLLDPSVEAGDALAAESRRLLALEGCSDGRVGRLALTPARLRRARQSLADAQRRVDRAIASLTPAQRRRRLAALLVQTTLRSEDPDQERQNVLEQLQRRPLVERLLAMCAQVQPHADRRVLWEGLTALVREEDVPMLRLLLDDPRVVVQTRVRLEDRKASDEPMLYFPVRDAVRRCLEALHRAADIVVEMPLDSPSAQRHVEMLYQRAPRVFEQLRPALRATGLARYRTLLMPPP